MLLYRWLNEATQTRGGTKAVVYRDSYHSWRGLHERVERRAREFHSMGISDGHWVGLMLGNVSDFVILALALSKIGATVVPLDPTTSARDLATILAAAPLRALITRPRGGVDAMPQASVLKSKKGSRTPTSPESKRRLQGTLLTCSIYKQERDAAPAGAEVVLFTSDSSGEPKGVLRTAEHLLAGIAHAKTTLEVSPDDKVLTTAPLYHAYGFDLGLCVALEQGATLYLEDEVSAQRVVKLLREQEVDLLLGMPSLYAELGKFPTARPLKTKRARFISAGNKLTDATADAFRERWGVRLLSLYHTTEAQTISLDRKGLSPESAGKAADGVEIKVVSATSRAAAGPVWVRSDAVSARAIGGAHESSGEASLVATGKGEVPIGGLDREGWYRTGDVGKLDKSGKLVLVGREDDVVKVDGKRIALGEVEGCIESFEKVKAAQALVITDPLAGPMVVAKVVVSRKCAADEIIDHCAKNLASYKVPRRIEFCESLPA